MRTKTLFLAGMLVYGAVTRFLDVCVTIPRPFVAVSYLTAPSCSSIHSGETNGHSSRIQQCHDCQRYQQ